MVSYLKGELNEIFAFECGVSTGHGYNLCLSSEKVVDAITTATEQLKRSKLLQMTKNAQFNYCLLG